MNTFSLGLCVLLAFLGATSAKMYGFGSCPDVSARRSFDIRKFSGTWYDQENYTPLIASSSCSSMDIARIPKSRSFRVSYGGRSDFSNSWWTENVTAEMTSPGVFEINTGTWSPVQITSVVATDYKSFALVHSCTNYYAFHYENVQILSRTRRPLATKAKKRVYKLMKGSDLSREFLNRIDQNDCQ